MIMNMEKVKTQQELLQEEVERRIKEIADVFKARKNNFTPEGLSAINKLLNEVRVKLD